MKWQTAVARRIYSSSAPKGCQIRRALCGALLLLILFSPDITSAHVGSDEKTNNRYYKLSPMADRVRLAYTIFFGRQPGNLLRRDIDSDQDGKISDGERTTYREKLAQEVFKSVSVQLNGSNVDVRWSDVSVGMGGDSVFDGPFSVDLIGSVCLINPAPDSLHSFVFRESLRLPLPGETELHLDPAPGIEVTKSVLNNKPMTGDQKRWFGGAGPAAKDGYELEFLVKNNESAGIDTLCDPVAESRTSKRLFWLFAAILAAIAAVFLARRRATKVNSRN